MPHAKRGHVEGHAVFLANLVIHIQIIEPAVDARFLVLIFLQALRIMVVRDNRKLRFLQNAIYDRIELFGAFSREHRKITAPPIGQQVAKRHEIGHFRQQDFGGINERLHLFKARLISDKEPKRSRMLTKIRIGIANPFRKSIRAQGFIRLKTSTLITNNKLHPLRGASIQDIQHILLLVAFTQVKIKAHRDGHPQLFPVLHRLFSKQAAVDVIPKTELNILIHNLTH